MSYFAAKTFVNHLGIKTIGIPVKNHCINVGYVAKALTEKYKDLPDWIPFICACHDVGKICPGFQGELLGQDIYKSPLNTYQKYHEYVSILALNNHIPPDPDNIPNNTPYYMILMHHGGNRSIGTNNNFNPTYCGDDSSHIKWNSERNKLINFLRKTFPYKDDLNCLNGKKFKNIRDYLAGYLCLADWIGSDERCFPSNCSSQIKINLAHPAAINAVKTFRISDIGLNNNPIPSFPEMFNGYAMRYIQEQMSLKLANSKPGSIILLEAPMGVGKTEAALYPALKLVSENKASGIYFGLPTMVTSNKIFERIKEACEKIPSCQILDIRLSHSKSSLYQNSSSHSLDSSWYVGNKRALISPIAIGTVDQALACHVPTIKHHHVRTFGLTKKVIILDEVHSYDFYTSGIMCKAIEKLSDLGCYIILLSATLTNESRQKLLGLKQPLQTIAPYPMMAISSPIENSPDKECEILDLSNNSSSNLEVTLTLKQTTPDTPDNDLLKDILNKIQKGYLVLWIENDVDTSQKVFSKALDLGLVPGETLGLLHSRYIAKERASSEDIWIKRYGKNAPRNKGCLLISTQVCEQSVDIDSDFLVSRICPTDMLLQRVGRLWRHSENNPQRLSKGISKPHLVVLHSHDYSEETFLNNSLKTFQKEKKYSKISNVYQDLKSGSYLGKSAFIYDIYYLFQTYHVLKSWGNLNIPNDIRPLIDKTYAPIQNPHEVQKILKNELLNNIDAMKPKVIQATQCHVLTGTLSDDNSNPFFGTRLDEGDALECSLVYKENGSFFLYPPSTTPTSLETKTNNTLALMDNHYIRVPGAKALVEYCKDTHKPISKDENVVTIIHKKPCLILDKNTHKSKESKELKHIYSYSPWTGLSKKKVLKP